MFSQPIWLIMPEKSGPMQIPRTLFRVARSFTCKKQPNISYLPLRPFREGDVSFGPSKKDGFDMFLVFPSHF